MRRTVRFWLSIFAGVTVLSLAVGCTHGSEIVEEVTNNALDASKDCDGDSCDCDGVGCQCEICDSEGCDGECNSPCTPMYTLNIIGHMVAIPPALNNPGRRIFPMLVGSTNIELVKGDFEVLDGNGTDGPARFSLPSPTEEVYTIFARTMAMPQGISETTVCAIDAAGVEVCSDITLELTRTHGKPTFQDVSDQLLYLYVNGQQYPLFDPAFKTYFWRYDNNQLKHAQLRVCGDRPEDGTDEIGDDDTGVTIE